MSETESNAETFAVWLERLAAPVPSPGGGAAAAATLAIGAAVTQMAAGYAPEGDERDAAVAAAASGRAEALAAGERDAAASEALVAAFRLPEDARSEMVLAEALREATEASLAIAGIAAPLQQVLVALADRGDPRLLPDVIVAARTIAAAVRAAAATARANLTSGSAAGDPADSARREREAVALGDRLDAFAASRTDVL
ncbi:MAG: formiminotransferase-cyclodeaminase [Microbacterium sp.]|uniref:cyclodeaminase/cyclohydrolase family protein n=1 Tax=unclassified Microbacterium TaxID=2609290 RepID=UPI000DB3AEDB|nr:cyclodeaminase/cyclohydrolase family protein [Microbacterium sp.]PZU40364.1 MAG: formiminotransferase-cyclodeaminase [Microbacterium sp.]